MSQFPPPESFDFTKPNTWSDWKQRFSRFRLATKLNKEDNEVQINSLIYAMGQEAEHVMKTFNFSESEDPNKFDDVFAKFDGYFKPSVNIIHERAKFHSRKQESNETIESFIRSLYELAETCNLDHKQDSIRDRLVIGLFDKRCSQKLQLESKLTLDKAIEIVRQNEQIKKEMEQQGSPIQSADAINKKTRGSGNKGFRKYHTSQKKRQSQVAESPNSNNTTRCTRCNLIHRHQPFCLAHGKKCTKCGNLNHFAVFCKTQRVRDVEKP